MPNENDNLEVLVKYEWRKSRIPAQDALVGFAPDDPRDEVVDALAASRPSRWYPMEGGTKVILLYRKGELYDATRFHVEPGAWDHEHCNRCGTQIPPMTLCWVT